MGYIYKIINSVNNKVYIGMTRRTIEQRWAEHVKTYNYENGRMYNFKIYKAMRDIGIEYFTPVLVEECPNEELEEKEVIDIKEI